MTDQPDVNAQPVETPESEAVDRRGRGGWLPIVLAVLAVALAVFIGSQVIGVLFAIVFPADAPLPENVVELEHESASYGVDEWYYSTATDACAIVRFYEANGGECRVAPGLCNSGFVEGGFLTEGQNVAQCEGQVEFSLFAMEWYANIATGYGEDQPTRFRLEREVFWGGQVPPAFPTLSPEELP